jgi:3-oxoacyl-[acyl-carrier-protein] synthase-3
MFKKTSGSYEAQAKRFIFIAHQANYMMLKTVCERRHIKPEHHWFNVDQFGNVGCCGAPAVLSMNWDIIYGREIILPW